jgi:hypothetical protein
MECIGFSIKLKFKMNLRRQQRGDTINIHERVQNIFAFFGKIFRQPSHLKTNETRWLSVPDSHQVWR